MRQHLIEHRTEYDPLWQMRQAEMRTRRLCKHVQYCKAALHMPNVRYESLSGPACTSRLHFDKSQRNDAAHCRRRNLHQTVAAVAKQGATRQLGQGVGRVRACA